MSARFTATLVSQAAAPEVEIPVTALVGTSTIGVIDGGLFTLATRGGPPRRVMLWVRDLEGVQVGVIT